MYDISKSLAEPSSPPVSLLLVIDVVCLFIRLFLFIYTNTIVVSWEHLFTIFFSQEEIQRLNDKILILEDENSKLISQIAPTADKPGLEKDDSNKNDSLSEADKETLNLLNAKLSEATQLYQKVSKDILKYQQVLEFFNYIQ